MLGVAAISSIQGLPAAVAVHLAVALILGVTALRLQRGMLHNPKAVALTLLATTWFIAAVTRAAFQSPVLPGAGVFAPWNAPREVAITSPLGSVPPTYEFHAAGQAMIDGPPSRFNDILFGQMGLSQGRALVNGYSPVGHYGLSRLLCWHGARWTCPDSTLRMLRVDDATGLTFAELMRVRRIVVERGEHLARVEGRMPTPWRMTGETPFAVTFERPLPNAHLPGSVAWPIAGVRIEPIGEPTARREALRVVRTEAAAQTIVFARTAWPGYRAMLDGTPVAVRSHADFLVAVDLPPGQGNSELVLSFAPAGFEAGRITAGAAALALLIYAAFLHGAIRRRRKGTVPDGPSENA